MNALADNTTKVLKYLFATYTSVLPSLESFSLTISGILLFFVALMMVRANTVGGKRDKFIDKWNLADMSKRKVSKAWNEVMQGIASGESAKMKKAINDADKVLDETLKAKGFVGKNVDERLNKVDNEQLENLKEVWQAHKLSDRIKKEPALVLTQNEARNIIHIYEKAFKEFGLID